MRVLFSEIVFADIITLRISRQDHTGLAWALNPMTSVLIKEERGRRDTEMAR